MFLNYKKNGVPIENARRENSQNASENITGYFANKAMIEEIKILFKHGISQEYCYIEPARDGKSKNHYSIPGLFAKNGNVEAIKTLLKDPILKRELSFFHGVVNHKDNESNTTVMTTATASTSTSTQSGTAFLKNKPTKLSIYEDYKTTSSILLKNPQIQVIDNALLFTLRDREHTQEQYISSSMDLR